MEIKKRFNIYQRCILMVTEHCSPTSQVENTVRSVIEEFCPANVDAVEYSGLVWEFGNGMEETDIDYIAGTVAERLPDSTLCAFCINIGNLAGQSELIYTYFNGQKLMCKTTGIPSPENDEQGSWHCIEC